MCIYILPAWMSVHRVCAQCPGGQKDTPEQELHVSVSYHVDARDQNWSSGRGDHALNLRVICLALI